MSKQQAFIERYDSIAVEEAMLSGVPASITMAQAILESGWGKSDLTVNANNFFGIKAHDWQGETYSAVTDEYDNGYYSEVASFRKYPTAYASFKDHTNFLKKNSRYHYLFSYPIDDYKSWARGLREAGYATSPTYDAKLINLIDQYGLHRLDTEARRNKMLYQVSLVLLILFVIAFLIGLATKRFT